MMYIIYQIMATSNESSADDFENGMRLGQVKVYKNHNQGNEENCDHIGVVAEAW